MVEVELSAVQTPTFVLFTTSFRSPAPPQRGTETHHLLELLYATSPSFEDSRPYSRHDQHDETTLETSFFLTQNRQNEGFDTKITLQRLHSATPERQSRDFRQCAVRVFNFS